MSKKYLLASTLQNRTVLPEAVDFDGSQDHLDRGADLTGNADGKTFTFSVWFYLTYTGLNQSAFYATDASDNGIQIVVQGDETIAAEAWNAAGTKVLQFATTTKIAKNTWNHVVISLDLANSSNRYVYINDTAASVAWYTYNNDSVDFTRPEHVVGAWGNGTIKLWEGRLANVFLDYTYRDLSSSANRRLFIDADGKPAGGQAALSPILYLPLTDATSPGTNLGTGGNFTLTGTVAQSGRGPNQDNAVACNLDGTADSLSKSSLTITASQQVTCSFWIKRTSIGTIEVLDGRGTVDTGNSGFRIQAQSSSNGRMLFQFYSTAAASYIQRYFYDFFEPDDRWYHIAFSVDASGTGNFQLHVNGASVTPVTTSDTTGTLDIAGSSHAICARFDGVKSGNMPVILSQFWFGTEYVDLDTSNPFYDSYTGKPVAMGTDGSLPTGTQPEIYLPMDGADAGNNLGSGGDFTVNSGPFTGARGASEFWARSVDFDGSTDYYRRTSALTGGGSSKTFTIVGAFRADSANGYLFELSNNLSTDNLYLVYSAGSKLTLDSFVSSSRIAEIASTPSLSTGQWHFFMISYDLTNTGKRHFYISNNGAAFSDSTSWVTYSNTALDLSVTDEQTIGAFGASNYFDGEIGFLWFDDSYIDFSQEANRLKFFDAFSYPVDIGEDGSTPTGSAPLVYMKFDDTSSLGTNSGTGGNFTENGTPSPGADVGA